MPNFEMPIMSFIKKEEDMTNHISKKATETAIEITQDEKNPDPDKKTEEKPTVDQNQISTDKPKKSNNELEPRIERLKYQEVLDKLKTIKNIFIRRNGDRLNELMDEKNLSIFSTSLNNIEKLFGDKTFDEEFLLKNLSAIYRAIESIDPIRRPSIKEDSDILRHLAINLNGLGEKCRASTKLFQSPPSADNAQGILLQMADLVNTKAKLIGQLHQAASNYTRR